MMSKRCGFDCRTCPAAALCSDLDLSIVEFAVSDSVEHGELKLTFFRGYCGKNSFYFHSVGALFDFVARVPVSARGLYFSVRFPDGSETRYDADFIPYRYADS